MMWFVSVTLFLLQKSQLIYYIRKINLVHLTLKNNTFSAEQSRAISFFFCISLVSVCVYVLLCVL